jgi:glycosyltransferase involved in cell wall biosynthesis
MDYLTQPPDARLLMAGEFEDEALRAHVMAQPGWAHVDAPGLLPRGALASVLANARVGLLLFQPAPNHDNAMPTKLFEYMGAGLPVVVSKLLAECAEIVGKHRCGILVDPRDSREIAQAIGYLLLRPDEAQAMGERGRKAIDGRYEWASEARTLLDLYRTVAS